MADDGGDEPQVAAEVPSIGGGDFVPLNKALRACFVCRLIKSDRQVCGCLCLVAAALQAGAGEKENATRLCARRRRAAAARRRLSTRTPRKHKP